tara:strand:- start:533 stop:1429 length:897 start_codon:yes stop_codon:yes gene_type:complete
MKTLLKILVAGIGLLVLLVILLVVLGLRSINTLVETGIEKGGTYALGVPTEVDGVKVSVFSGTFAMDGMTVANPEGYPSERFMSLPSLDLAVDTGSLTGEVITIPSLALGTIGVTLDGTGGTPNYQVILDNMEKFEGKGGGGEPADPSSEGPRFVINSLVLEGAQVKVTNFTGVQQLTGDVDIAVPRVELKDVGSAEPLTTSELIELIVKTVMSTTVANAGGVLPADLLDGIRGQLGDLSGLGDLGITAIGDIGTLGEDLGKEAQEKLDEVKDEAERTVKDTIGNLLGGGGKKDEDDG